MSFDDLVKWAQVFNLLLLPIAIAIINMRLMIAKLIAELSAHATLDNARFDTQRRDLDFAHAGLRELGKTVQQHDSTIAVLKDRAA